MEQDSRPESCPVPEAAGLRLDRLGDRVRRIHGFPDHFRLLGSLGSGDHGILDIPLFGERGQGSHGGLFGRPQADLPEIGGDLFPIRLMGRTSGVQNRVDHSQRDFSFREHRVDRLVESGEPADYGYEAILEPSVLKLGRDAKYKMTPSFCSAQSPKSSFWPSIRIAGGFPNIRATSQGLLVWYP